MLIPMLNHAQGIRIESAKLVLKSGVHVYVDGGSNGGINIQGTGYIKSIDSSTLSIEGNYDNQSDNEGMVWTGSSTVKLVGSSQSISGTGLIDTKFCHLHCVGDGTKMTQTHARIDSLIKLNQSLMINSFTLSLGGTSSGNEFIYGSSISSMKILSGANINIRMHPVNSFSKMLNNLTIYTNSTISLGDTMYINGIINMESNTNLNTNGKLVLMSDASSTAFINTLTTTSLINGNVVVQRYIPGGNNKRKWRLLSSPVNTNGTAIQLNQFIDDIYVTGVGGSSQGFDDCNGCNPSIRTYNEAISGGSSIGWTNPVSITDQLSTATGAAVFIRGSRNLANPFLNWTVPDNVTIDFIGNINTGDITKNLSYTNTGNSLGDGFNLVGNPYPCAIDWMAASGWTRTNIQNYMWVYNANTGTYGVISTTGVKSGDASITRYLAPGQAFFVRSTSSGASITFSESVKTTSTPFNFFKGVSPLPVLKVSLDFNQIKHDELIFVFDSTSTTSGNDNNDAIKFMNDKINLYSITNDLMPLTINYIPTPASVDTIRLAVWDFDTTNVQTGIHQLHFDSLDTLDPRMNIYLLDEYTSTLVNIRTQPQYGFEISTDAKSYGTNRFKLIFDITSGIQNDVQFNFIVYPNPANDKLFTKINSSTLSNQYFDLIIRNILGQEVVKLERKSVQELEEINIKEINPGMYTLSIIQGKRVYYKKFIKE